MKTNDNTIHDEAGASSVSAAVITANIVAIWQEVLGRKEIDIRGSYIDQGGNSINAILLMYRMKKAGYRVTLRDIMHHQTIEQLVQELFVSAVVPVSAAASVAVGSRYDYRMAAGEQEEVMLVDCRSKLQQALLDNDRLFQSGPVSQHYPLCAMQELQIAFRTVSSLDVVQVDARLDEVVLARAYGELISRHGLLRSVAVRSGSRHYWEEHVPQAVLPVIPMLDLSAFRGDDPAFLALTVQLVSRFYEAGTIFHQLVLVRRNAEEVYLVLVFSHVIFDRVTGEVVKSQLLQLYGDLLGQGTLRPAVIVPFERYVSQIGKGPQGIGVAEVIRSFELADFHASKQEILLRISDTAADVSSSFSIVVPMGEHREADILAATLTIYARALQRYLGVGKLPLLFVCDGRQYEGQRYYDTVGEFTDMVPMVITADAAVAVTGETVSSRLADLKRYNLNFLHLLLDPPVEGDWAAVSRLMDAGHQYDRFDILMFNFLGNADDASVPDEGNVVTQPNPLPIYSLLNCIASFAGDKLVFTFRSSYAIDIERLRSLFLEVMREPVL